MKNSFYHKKKLFEYELILRKHVYLQDKLKDHHMALNNLFFHQSLIHHKLRIFLLIYT